MTDSSHDDDRGASTPADDAAGPDQAPAPPRTTAPRLGRLQVVRLTLVAACVALSVAYFGVIRPAEQRHDRDTLTVDQLLSSGSSTTVADHPVLKVGDPLPPMDLAALAGVGTSTSHRFRVAADGRATLINLWASNCAPCVKELPLLESEHLRRADSVRFVGIDALEGGDAPVAMVRRFGLTYEQAVDPEGSILARFGVAALPATVVVDAAGTITAIHHGAIPDATTLSNLLDEALD
ncbi:MAG: TlpA disulfide reductase family protein [Microthrixaceae bacterium]